MNITRRIALKNLLIVAAGTALLPSCMQDDKKSSINLKHLQLSRDHEKALAALTETIIPTTDTPGAKDISAHLFVLLMVDDCYAREEQEAFMQGFDAFLKQVQTKYNKPFEDCDQAQKETFLTALEKDQEDNQPVHSFYKSAKGLTVFGYTTSQYYLTKVKGYNIIPGKYQGAVPVNSTKPLSA